MEQMIMKPMIIEGEIRDRCGPNNCFNQVMALVLIEILNQQWEGPLAEEWKKIMKVGCFVINQSEIEDFAGRVFMALHNLCCQNGENQWNDLESFTEIMSLLHHGEIDQAIKTFNELIFTDKQFGLDRENFYLGKIAQYCRDPETVKIFKRRFYTQES